MTSVQAAWFTVALIVVYGPRLARWIGDLTEAKEARWRDPGLDRLGATVDRAREFNNTKGER